MGTKKLQDVIDINFLQKFQDAFSSATGMASISTDLEGSATNPSNFTDFCIKLTRGTEEGLRRCVECDLKGGEESERTGRPSVYYCHAGLMDFGAPIIVDGEQIGSVIGGQVLPSPPDEDKFRKIALEIGLDPDEYITALRKIKIVPENQIRQAAELLFLTLNQVTQNQTQYSRLKTAHSVIDEQINQIHTNLNEFIDSLTEIDENQRSFITQIQSVMDIAKQINDVVKLVASIAERTHLVSVNASIEAARLGASAAAFTVIAQEIRSLANESKKTVTRIEKLTEEITKSVSYILDLLTVNSNNLNTQISGAKNISPMLVAILNELKELEH